MLTSACDLGLALFELCIEPFEKFFQVGLVEAAPAAARGHDLGAIQGLHDQPEQVQLKSYFDALPKQPPQALAVLVPKTPERAQARRLRLPRPS